MTSSKASSICGVLCAWVLLPAGAAGADWTSWRGPEQGGVSRETGLPETWSPDGENLVWKAPFGGRSTPVVHDGRVYVLNLAGTGVSKQERIQCLSAETGKPLWEHRFNVFLSDIPAPRVGWASPAVDPETGNVYVHGVQNTFLCLDRDGRVLWERQLHEEFGTITGYGGRTHTPVVDEDLVIIGFLNSSWGSHGRGGHRYLAMDKRTGKAAWWSQPGGAPTDTTYSVPVVAVVNGTRLLINGDADGSIYAMKVRTGEKVWGFRLSERGINSSVVFEDDTVFASHSEENVDSTALGRVVAIDATGTGDVTATHERWRAEGVEAGYSSPAIHDGKLYVIDNSANLHCFEAKTGKRLWEHSCGTVMKASPVVADGKIYVSEVSSRFLILRPGEASCTTLSTTQFRAADGTIVELNGSPAVSNGRIYFATRDELYSIGLPRWSGQRGEPRSVAPEPPAADDEAPAHLQIVPADVLLAPGGSARLEGRLFDARGRLLRTCAPEWTLQGLQGSFQPDGTFTLAPGSGLRTGTIVGKVGALTGEVRVRSVPPLPLSLDFEGAEEGKPPSGWIGAGSKFAVAAIDGQKALQKLSKDQRFLQAETFIGEPTMRDYTISSDVRVTETRRNLPNAGLINCRYSLLLMGNLGKLRIVSWVPEPRIDVVKPFALEPDVWYRMVFRVEARDGKALARGKVWRRGEPEPAEWTIEAEDPVPNTRGSPGLEAYSAGTTARSAGAEVFFDNLLISENAS